MLQPINYHIWFKVCKSIKHKYNLSTNCLLVLNGVYLYSEVFNMSFTRFALLKFVTYYDNVRLGKYLSVLIGLKFIIESGLYKGHQLYCISPDGLQVIKELNDSYIIELNKFIDKYHVIL